MPQDMSANDSISRSTRGVGRVAGALVWAVLLSTLIAVTLFISLGSIAWLAGFDGMILLIALTLCLWVAGIIYFSITFVRDVGARTTEPSQVASNPSLERP
jgi:hypothetical protein